MTNEQIIGTERIRLMNEGLIGTTGKEIEITDENGLTKTIKEPDEIHTYQVWKNLGQQVRRGSKAITKLKIWKRVPGKTEDLPDKMFLCTASFFSRSQCETIW